MQITENDLCACKEYMRVDFDDEDLLITSLMTSAVDYLALAQNQTLDPLERLAVNALTLHWYDHRDSVGTETAFPTGLRPIINQIKANQTIAAAEVGA